jgi:uncharacterized protein YbbK (DUF523 family)
MDRTRLLVSACLAGEACRYDCRAKPDAAAVAAVRAGEAIALCAEQLGGLPTPRSAAEIVGGDGYDVLAGTAAVVTIEGEDCTDAFVRGAQIVAERAVAAGVTRAVLQARSPSCGAGTIYDGTHSGQLVPGDGVLAALLRSRGIAVTSVRGTSAESNTSAPV